MDWQHTSFPAHVHWSGYRIHLRRWVCPLAHAGGIFPCRLWPNDALVGHQLLPGSASPSNLHRHRLWMSFRPWRCYPIDILQHKDRNSHGPRSIWIISRRSHLPNHLPPPPTDHRLPMGNPRHWIHRTLRTCHLQLRPSRAHNPRLSSQVPRPSGIQRARIRPLRSGQLPRLHGSLCRLLLRANLRNPNQDCQRRHGILSPVRFERRLSLRPHHPQLHRGSYWPDEHDRSLCSHLWHPGSLFDCGA